MPTLLILAAGMGSRYGGLKQLDPVGPGGQTLMDYSIFDALRAGFDRLVFVIRRSFAADFQAHVGSRFQSHAALSYAYQELTAYTGDFVPSAERLKPWGTGHAILSAADLIGEPFATINADDYYGPRAFAAMAQCLGSPECCHAARYAMVGYRLRNTLSAHGTVARGVCDVDPEGRLRKVTECVGIEMHGSGARFPEAEGRMRELTGDEFVSMNFWGFHPSIFGHLKEQFAEFLASRGQDPKSEFYIPSVVDRLIGEGKAEARVLPTEDSWFGVTYREDRESVMESIRALVERGDYPQELF